MDLSRRLNWQDDVVTVDDSDSDNDNEAVSTHGDTNTNQTKLGNATGGAEYQYVNDDSTVAAPSSRFHCPTTTTATSSGRNKAGASTDGPVRRKIVVLPVHLPPRPSSSADAIPDTNANDSGHYGDGSSQLASTPRALGGAAAGVAGTATTPEDDGNAFSSSLSSARVSAVYGGYHPSGGGVVAGVGVEGQRDATAIAAMTASEEEEAALLRGTLLHVLVRLPHPRHGTPSLFLCPTTATAEDKTANTNTNHDHDAAVVHASQLNTLLHEVQYQSPPGSYAQSWFVEYTNTNNSSGSSRPSTAANARVEEVLPCNDVLVSTPVHLTYLAIQALVAITSEEGSDGDGDGGGGGGGGRFMSAEDLFSPENHRQSTSNINNRDERYSHPYRPAATTTTTATMDSSSYDVDGGFDYGELVDPFAQHQTGEEEEEGEEGIQARKRAKAEGNDGTTTTITSTSWWSGWPSAVAACPALLPCWRALTSPACLTPVCDVKAVGGTCYYRFSKVKAVAWLSRRVKAVQRSRPLRSLLQLDKEQEKAADGNTINSSSTVMEAPIAVAYGVISEYIPEAIAAAVAEACGPTSPSSSLFGGDGATNAFNNTSASVHPHPSTSSSSAVAPLASAAGKAAAAAQPPLKSASVKRLEKAGRPKGTPTLFAMFAKKPPTDPK